MVVTRRKTDAFAAPKFSGVVVNMDRLEEEVAPHAQARITAAIHSARRHLSHTSKYLPENSSVPCTERRESRIELLLPCCSSR